MPNSTVAPVFMSTMTSSARVAISSTTRSVVTSIVSAGQDDATINAVQTHHKSLGAPAISIITVLSLFAFVALICGMQKAIETFLHYRQRKDDGHSQQGALFHRCWVNITTRPSSEAEDTAALRSSILPTSRESYKSHQSETDTLYLPILFREKSTTSDASDDKTEVSPEDEELASMRFTKEHEYVYDPTDTLRMR